MEFINPCDKDLFSKVPTLLSKTLDSCLLSFGTILSLLDTITKKGKDFSQLTGGAIQLLFLWILTLELF